MATNGVLSPQLPKLTSWRRSVHKRSKVTVYVEGGNLLHHTNARYFGLNMYHFSTGAVTLINDKMLPILPSAGFTLEF